MTRRRAGVQRPPRARTHTTSGPPRWTAPRLGWRWLIAGVAVLVIGGSAWLYVDARADRAATAPLATLRTADFHALVFHPTDPNVAFFGHHNGVMRTDDGGRTWRPLVARANFDAMGMAVDQRNPQTLYLAGHDIFQVSGDGGASWRPVSHNLPGTDIHGFAVSAEDPNRLYALVVGHGLLRSGDRGASWEAVGQAPADVMSIAAAGGNPETLYATSMRSGLMRSADGGRTWAAAGSGLSGMVLAIAVDPAAPQNAYAGTERGLYRSTDAGMTWRALPFPGQNAVAVTVSPARPGRLLAITTRGNEGLVYGSEDGGESWRSE